MMTKPVQFFAFLVIAFSSTTTGSLGLAKYDDKYSPRLDLDLRYLSIREVHSRIRLGASCRSIIQLFLDRIRRYDRAPPLGLGGVITVNPQALTDANRLDAYMDGHGGNMVGPLHCIPVMVKDVIMVKGLPTTLGVNMFKNAIANIDAPVVASMRKAGAVILGKSNLKPFALGGVEEESQNGGETRNPYDPLATVYGSSSGNAVCQAARYSVLGLGSDTTGSILGPASASNSIGFRPSLNMFSFEGILPGVPYEDTIAPIANTVEDMGILLDVLTGQTLPYYAAFDTSNIHHTRLGIISDFAWKSKTIVYDNITYHYEVDPEASKLLTRTLADWSELGMNVVNLTDPYLDYILKDLAPAQVHIPACYPGWIDQFLGRHPLQSVSNGLIRSFRQMVATRQLPVKLQYHFENIQSRKQNCPAANRTFLVNRNTMRTFIAHQFKLADLIAFPAYPGL